MIDIVLNIYLPRFFNWVIETSIMASILVGLILCIKTLLRNRLTPRWHYLLWMILIVRLLLPWSPDSSYSVYSILSYGYESIVSVQSLHETTSLSGSNVVTDEERSTAGTPQTITESKKETMIRNEKQKDEPLSIHNIALYLWLTGVIALGFTTYLVNRRLHHYIKQQPVMTDDRIVKTFENCKKSMSVQQNIPLLLAGKIASPTVLGFFRPRVLLSSHHINRLDEQQLRHIFHHELAHIKRRDVGLNWLIHCLLILNWFNPIIWFAYVCMREDQELACDAYALTFMEEEEKIPYGLTIISLLEHYSNYYQVPSLANLSRNKRTLKRRIFMIKKFQKKSYRWSALGVIAVVAVASLSLLNPQADGSNENPSVLIYHTHNTESFTPLLNINDPMNAIDNKKNITLVGEELSESLERKGIQSIHDKSDIQKITKSKGWNFAKSYEVARGIIKKTLDENKDIKLIMDIHRDSRKHEHTTVEINGKSVSRITFVVSHISSKYEENRYIAQLFHNKLEEKYPGISSGILTMGKETNNTYNQDLFGNSLLVEIGGVENTLEEEYRSTEILSEIIDDVLNEIE